MTNCDLSILQYYIRHGEIGECIMAKQEWIRRWEMEYPFSLNASNEKINNEVKI